MMRERASFREERRGSGEVRQRYRVVRALPDGAIVGEEIRIRRVVRRNRLA